MAFKIESIPPHIIQSMKNHNIWNESCPVKITDLSLATVSHYDFDGEIKEGQLVVHAKIVENVIKIFKQLYELKFEIHQIKLIDEYGGNDELSMQDNNSSCFNCRTIAGSKKLSIHSYGLAIDINPIQNPYISDGIVNSIQESNFLDRNNQRPGMVEPIVHIFKENGFPIWGGNWKVPIDYQHFQVNQ
jgi:D-alanyl-D-alanine carboxypeptidase